MLGLIDVGATASEEMLTFRQSVLMLREDHHPAMDEVNTDELLKNRAASSQWQRIANAKVVNPNASGRPYVAPQTRALSGAIEVVGWFKTDCSAQPQRRQGSEIQRLQSQLRASERRERDVARNLEDTQTHLAAAQTQLAETQQRLANTLQKLADAQNLIMMMNEQADHGMFGDDMESDQ